MKSLNEHIKELRREIFTELRAFIGDVTDQNNGAETPLAIAHAAEFRSIEKLIEDAAKQITPVSADSSEKNAIGTLEYYGKLKGITRKLAKSGIYYAKIVAVPGTNGGFIPLQTEFTGTTGDTEINLYSITEAQITESEAKLTAENPINYIQVQTVETGVVSRLVDKTKITFNTSIPNIEGQAIIVYEDDKPVQEPADEESIEDFRNRIINAFRYEISGGSATDFRLWALEIDGIKNAYPYNAIPNNGFANGENTANLGLGFPRIYLEFSDDAENQDNIKKKYIAALSQKAPMNTGQVIVQPCRVKTFRILIDDSQIQGSADIKDVFESVCDSINSYFESKRPYIPAIDLFDNSQINKIELFLKINADAQAAKENNFFMITDFQWFDGESQTSPQLDDIFELTCGEIPKLKVLSNKTGGKNYAEKGV